jgi:LuxR family quorum-sensing system transcriptional regulator SolR
VSELIASPEELQALQEITTALSCETMSVPGLDGVARRIRALLPFDKCVLVHARGKGPTLMYECASGAQDTVAGELRSVPSFEIDPYLQTLERTEISSNAFSWRTSDAHGVAGLTHSEDGAHVGAVTLIQLRYGPAEIPPTHLFFMNIVLFYLHVCLLRGAPSLMICEPQPSLTAKEREVLQWIVGGKTSWEVGKILSVSERTVKFHLRNIYSKLDVANRAHAVTKASRLGLI